MQKAVQQMNLELTNALSDVSGETGQKIIRATLAPALQVQVSLPPPRKTRIVPRPPSAWPPAASCIAKAHWAPIAAI